MRRNSLGARLALGGRAPDTRTLVAVGGQELTAAEVMARASVVDEALRAELQAVWDAAAVAAVGAAQ